MPDQMSSAQFAQAIVSGGDVGESSSSTTKDLPPAGVREESAPEVEPEEVEEEGSEPEPEPEESDDSEPKPWYEKHAKIHGLDAEEVLEALAEGRIPEALLDKLKLQVEDEDYEWEDNLSNLKSNAMLRRRFTQKTQELARERQEFQGQLQSLNDYFESWKGNPKKLIRGLRKMGMPVEDALFEVVSELSKAERMNKLEAGSGDEWLETVRRQADLEELQNLQQQQEQQQQQQQYGQLVEATIEVAKSEALRAKFQWDEVSWGELNRLVSEHLDRSKQWPNSATVRTYVRKAKQLADSIAAQQLAQRKPKPKTVSKTAPKTDGAAPKKTAPTSRPAAEERISSAEALKRAMRGERF